MEKQKLIIFAHQEYYAQAMNAFFQVASEKPNQQVGEEFAENVDVAGVDFKVIRNELSYTVEEL